MSCGKGRKHERRAAKAAHGGRHVVEYMWDDPDGKFRLLDKTSPSSTIFQTEAGGRRLGNFLHATQALLRLLPPRPTPP
jgi:hypothetical protein